jgi:hypothetical protein
MKKVAIVIACGLFCAACGGKVDELKKGIDGLQQAAKVGEQVAKSAENVEKTQNEAEEAYKARAAKGDTVVMPYKDLQAFLPTAISGYKLDGEPSGATTSMTGFSNSTTTQKWTSEAGNGANIEVTIADWGGTKEAYGMASMATGMGLQMSVDNDEQHAETIKPDLPQTSGLVTFQKKTKASNVVLSTRYRYIITLQSNNGTEDQTKMLTDLGLEIAKKFDGK